MKKESNIFILPRFRTNDTQALFLLATGSNENADGLLRELFPKGTDFAQMTDEALCRVLYLISHRPRKCLS